MQFFYWKIVNILEFVLHLSLMRLQNYQQQPKPFFPLAFKLPSLPVHKKVQPIYRHLFNKLLLTWKRKKAEKNPDLMASFWYQFVRIHKNNGNEKMKGIMFHRTMRCQGHVSVFCGVGIFFVVMMFGLFFAWLNQNDVCARSISLSCFITSMTTSSAWCSWTNTSHILYSTSLQVFSLRQHNQYLNHEDDLVQTNHYATFFQKKLLLLFFIKQRQRVL